MRKVRLRLPEGLPPEAYFFEPSQDLVKYGLVCTSQVSKRLGYMENITLLLLNSGEKPVRLPPGCHVGTCLRLYACHLRNQLEVASPNQTVTDAEYATNQTVTDAEYISPQRLSWENHTYLRTNAK
jgi:hypothetical protein